MRRLEVVGEATLDSNFELSPLCRPARDGSVTTRETSLMTSGDHESSFAPGAPPPGPAVVAWNVSGAPPLREGPGTRIGPYTIVRQIGEGGFGAVFLAEQLEPVKRTVALKILKLGMDT